MNYKANLLKILEDINNETKKYEDKTKKISYITKVFINDYFKDSFFEKYSLNKEPLVFFEKLKKDKTMQDKPYHKFIECTSEVIFKDRNFINSFEKLINQPEYKPFYVVLSIMAFEEILGKYKPLLNVGSDCGAFDSKYNIIINKMNSMLKTEDYENFSENFIEIINLTKKHIAQTQKEYSRQLESAISVLVSEILFHSIPNSVSIALKECSKAEEYCDLLTTKVKKEKLVDINILKKLENCDSILGGFFGFEIAYKPFYELIENYNKEILEKMNRKTFVIKKEEKATKDFETALKKIVTNEAKPTKKKIKSDIYHFVDKDVCYSDEFEREIEDLLKPVIVQNVLYGNFIDLVNSAINKYDDSNRKNKLYYVINYLQKNNVNHSTNVALTLLNDQLFERKNSQRKKLQK